MPTKEDLRVIKTKRNIEETFLSLLEKSTFEHITVKQILEAALISKGTFYAHYLDKYDLAEKLVARALQEFRLGIHERLVWLLSKDSQSEVWPSLQKTMQKTIPRLILLRKIRTDTIDVNDSMKSIIREEFLAFQESRGVKLSNPTLNAQIVTNLVMGFIEWQLEHPNQISLKDYIKEIHSLSAEYIKWLT